MCCGFGIREKIVSARMDATRINGDIVAQPLSIPKKMT